MRKLVSVIVLCFGFLYIAHAQIDDAKPKKILNQAKDYMTSFEDVSVEFEYNIKNEVHDIDEQNRGKAMMKGSQYRIEIEDQIMMSDGETAWTYLPESEEVQVLSLDDNDQSNPLNVLTSWQENYRSKYIRMETIAGRDIHIIDLIPHEGRSFFKIRVRINDANNQLVSSTIYDKNSTTYTYIIHEFNTNEGISDSKFRFDESSHPGVEVIDLR
ncbi:MAG: outer membrane lipoprotein carrier protein LolA [Bacteroidales bacterium]